MEVSITGGSPRIRWLIRTGKSFIKKWTPPNHDPLVAWFLLQLVMIGCTIWILFENSFGDHIKKARWFRNHLEEISRLSRVHHLPPATPLPEGGSCSGDWDIVIHLNTTGPSTSTADIKGSAGFATGGDLWTNKNHTEMTLKISCGWRMSIHTGPYLDQFPAVLLFIKSKRCRVWTRTQLVDGEVRHEDGVVTQFWEGGTPRMSKLWLSAVMTSLAWCLGSWNLLNSVETGRGCMGWTIDMWKNQESRAESPQAV